jgi:DNA-binding HxlR family transcriptional regulator
MPKTTDNLSEESSRLLLDQLADKWTIRILRSFCPGNAPVRFNEIKRRVVGISQKTLTQCLRKLERNGILERRVIAASPLGVEYSITSLGMTLQGPMESLHLWAKEHVASVLVAQKNFDGQARQPTGIEIRQSVQLQ